MSIPIQRIFQAVPGLDARWGMSGLVGPEEARGGSATQGQTGDAVLNRLAGEGLEALVIDDEQAILRVTAMMLRKLGLDSRPILSGLEGFDVLCEERDRFGVLVLDIMLADSSGLDIYERIRSGDMGVPILFCSGFAQVDVLQRTLERDRSTRFLAKPFGLADLRHALLDLLA